MTDRASNALPRLILQDYDNLISVLRFIQRLLDQNPRAVGAIVQAVVAEGYRFAESPDGQRWKVLLTQSELMQRGRLIWDSYGFGSLMDTTPARGPSDWLDLIASELMNADLETVLTQLIDVREGV
jgi:hypothetical protein